MIFSIICTYSDKESLDKNLLRSLRKQDDNYQLILVDNRHNKSFNSAASALNWAAQKAKGEYLIFVHQDIVLVGHDWLKKAMEIITNLPKLGIAGVAGRNSNNERVGYLDDGGKPWASPSINPKLLKLWMSVW